MAKKKRVVRTTGKVTMSVGKISGAKDYMEITIKDEASRVEVVKVAVSFEDFTKVITGQYLTDIPVTFGPLSLVGCKHEHTEVSVNVGKLPDDEKKRYTAVRKAVKPHEVDGWRATRLNDAWNMHRRLGQGICSMFFERWIDDYGKPVEVTAQGAHEVE